MVNMREAGSCGPSALADILVLSCKATWVRCWIATRNIALC